jgi:hypothetical protein
MTRRVVLFATSLIAVAGTASAQHLHSSGGYYPSSGGYYPSSGGYYPSTGGHYHVEPGHLHRHGNHYDYHPGRTIYHPDSHSYYPPRTTYVRPYTPAHPDAYDGHSHEHEAHGAGYRGEFGGYGHIDDLASQLEQEANLLCLEMHYNYQHNPGYRQTYREAYEILTTARYIHGLEHAGNRDKIRESIVGLDALFHHVEDDVRHWTRHNHRYLGSGGLPAKLAAVEETLHHLMNDVGATSQFGAEGGIEVAPPAGGSPGVIIGP